MHTIKYIPVCTMLVCVVVWGKSLYVAYIGQVVCLQTRYHIWYCTILYSVQYSQHACTCNSCIVSFSYTDCIGFLHALHICTHPRSLPVPGEYGFKFICDQMVSLLFQNIIMSVQYSVYLGYFAWTLCRIVI